MTLTTLVLRSLRHYRGTGLAVLFGVAIATAVLIGSLLVGSSVRGSIRDVALARLGGVDAAIFSPGFFRQALAEDLVKSTPAFQGRVVAPVLIAQGTVSSADTNITAPAVNVIGCDADFGQLMGGSLSGIDNEEAGPTAIVNAALAADLHLPASGGRVLVTLAQQPGVAGDMLFAQRKKDLTTKRSSLDVEVASDRAADFSVSAQDSTPRNLFVSLDWVATHLGKPGKADAILIGGGQAGGSGAEKGSQTGVSDLPKVVPAELCRAEDYGLKFVPHPETGYLSVESESFLLSPAQRQGVVAAAKTAGLTPEITSVYMATTMHETDAIYGSPFMTANYAMVAGVGSTTGMNNGQTGVSVLPASGSEQLGSAIPDDGIILDDWIAQDAGAYVGEKLTLFYFTPAYDGVYGTKSVKLKVTAIVPTAGRWVDPGLVPTIVGITDARSMDNWETPFPVDKQVIRPRDEQYWSAHHAAPKAFVSLKTAKAMWQSGPAGADADWVTSVRFYPPAGASLDDVTKQLSDALPKAITPEQAGLQIRQVRNIAVNSAQGTTDFGQLFLAFGLFLVASAAGLAGTMMRLMADRRATQAGIMLACGFTQADVRRAIIAEGAVLAVLGVMIGTPLGVGYAWAIIMGLRSWWSGAVGTSALWLHIEAASVVYGAISGLLIGILTSAWGAWHLGSLRVLNLLAGWQAQGVQPVSRSNRDALLISAVFLLVIAGALIVLALYHVTGAATTAFGAGTALLAAGLCVTTLALMRAVDARKGIPTFIRLALRSAAANRGRSVLAVALLASAGFIIVTVAANARDTGHMNLAARTSGTGGFALRVTSALPIRYDPGTTSGRKGLDFSPEDEQVMAGTTVVSFPESPGEDISCLNLAKPSIPRVLGVDEGMMQRGGFTVRTVGAKTDAPWRALETPQPDGVIPVFGDADSVMWTLHADLGQTYTIPAEDGHQVTLRFVGLVQASIFAGELLMSEANFRRCFPSSVTPRFFLIDAPASQAGAVADALRRNLGDYGAEVRPTGELLATYLMVQNTYLSTFLAIGSLGILLGTLGLLVVLLRNALERAREFGLMLAVGFTIGHLAGLLLLENAGLLLAGLLCGALSAGIAVLPQARSAGTPLHWVTAGLLLLGILLFGLLSSAITVRFVVSNDVIRALREE